MLGVCETWARDSNGRYLRTVTVRYLHLIRRETGLEPWEESLAAIKKVLVEKEKNLEIPTVDEWRVPYLALFL